MKNMINMITINSYIERKNITNIDEFLNEIHKYSLLNDIKIQCLDASMIYS